MKWYTERVKLLILLLALMACGPSSTPEPSGPMSPEGAPWPEVQAAPVANLLTDARPLPRDIAAMRRVTALTISPDGTQLAYVVRVPTYDAEAKPSDDDTTGGWTSESQLYVVARSGGTPRQLTRGKHAVSSLHFSPDSSAIAFARKHDGKRHIHVMSLAGGEARVVEIDDHQPGAFAWSPDGTKFAFTANRPFTDEEKEARFRSGGARHYDQDWRQRHLFTVGVDGGEPVHINQGTETIVSFDWSPDGTKFAVVVAESSDPYQAWLRHKLRIISASDGETVAEIETDPASIDHVSWSPQGTHVAYERASQTLSLMNELRVFELESGETRDLAEGLDPSLSGYVWGAREIVAVLQAGTQSQLQRLPLRGNASVIRHGDRIVWPHNADQSGRYMAALTSSNTSPVNPSVVDTRSGVVQVLVDVNPQVSEWTLAEVEVVQWDNGRGDEIEGVLFRTAGEGPRPLMVLPHGGPDSVTQQSFSAWGHYFAARGYSVFRPNYRGGFGYGKAFYEANRGRLGEIELEDIESGVDHLVAEGIADEDQLFYGGWSWGGYLSAWTLGHTEDRYRAFVVGAGVTDTVVQYVTSDINHGEVADWEFRGRPWSDPTSYARSNPALHFQNATQPTLVIHGERDTRVAFVQGQLLYRALQDAECEVDFFAYPREPHGFREPAHVEHLLTQWAAWYDSHRE